MTISTVTVRNVRSRAERAAFINLPWRLYRGDPHWIPPLKASVREALDQRKHPFYNNGKSAEIELFLAWEGREAVGRVAAILNHAHNGFHGENVAHFGFFECIDRPDVARSLLETVEAWARDRGLTALLGPFNPSTNFECGLLVHGFGRPPVVMMTYNPPHYGRLIEGAGFSKTKDLLAYISTVHGRSLMRLQKLAERTKSRSPDLVTRGVDLKNFEAEVAVVQEIYNSAWEKNWGFVPMNDGEIRIMARELKPLVEPELLRFAFIDGEPAAFLLALPDWNPVLKDFNGSPMRHPLKTIKHLVKTKASDMEGLRLITMGVKEKFRKRGLEGLLIAEGLTTSLDIGFSWCEYSWILEDNELIKGAVRLLDGELYKTYRIYEKALSA
ncbi:MAG: glycerol-3-phosphate dehydrogenase/oxidase [Thermoanaerobaculales bacterium]|nr:glycerol-3-phosphate dehydrogenase/oxidase [Thermoanaerobaculales bacterium]